ncbi:hypothetical protein F4703DRAFT_1823942 [Phycomyces blakesleeanus]
MYNYLFIYIIIIFIYLSIYQTFFFFFFFKSHTSLHFTSFIPFCAFFFPSFFFLINKCL